MTALFTVTEVYLNAEALNGVLSSYVTSFEEGILESGSSESDKAENPL